MTKFGGKSGSWSDWAFILKVMARAASSDLVLILEWIETRGLIIDASELDQHFLSTFVNVRHIDKLRSEVFDLLCTICEDNALGVVRSAPAMD